MFMHTLFVGCVLTLDAHEYDLTAGKRRGQPWWYRSSPVDLRFRTAEKAQAPTIRDWTELCPANIPGLNLDNPERFHPF